MRWAKRGLVVPTPPPVPWGVSHAMVPFVQTSGDEVRLFFSARDDEGRSVTGYGDFDPREPGTIRYGERPLLGPGPLGAFDDRGAMGSCFVEHGGEQRLYYIGWNLGVTVPFLTFVGLAASTDGGARSPGFLRRLWSSEDRTTRT